MMNAKESISAVTDIVNSNYLYPWLRSFVVSSSHCFTKRRFPSRQAEKISSILRPKIWTTYNFLRLKSQSCQKPHIVNDITDVVRRSSFFDRAAPIEARMVYTAHGLGSGPKLTNRTIVTNATAFLVIQPCPQ